MSSGYPSSRSSFCYLCLPSSFRFVLTTTPAVGCWLCPSLVKLSSRSVNCCCCCSLVVVLDRGWFVLLLVRWLFWVGSSSMVPVPVPSWLPTPRSFCAHLYLCLYLCCGLVPLRVLRTCTHYRYRPPLPVRFARTRILRARARTHTPFTHLPPVRRAFCRFLPVPTFTAHLCSAARTRTLYFYLYLLPTAFIYRTPTHTAALPRAPFALPTRAPLPLPLPLPLQVRSAHATFTPVFVVPVGCWFLLVKLFVPVVGSLVMSWLVRTSCAVGWLDGCCFCCSVLLCLCPACTQFCPVAVCAAAPLHTHARVLCRVCFYTRLYLAGLPHLPTHTYRTYTRFWFVYGSLPRAPRLLPSAPRILHTALCRRFCRTARAHALPRFCPTYRAPHCRAPHARFGALFTRTLCALLTLRTRPSGSARFVARCRTLYAAHAHTILRFACILPAFTTPAHLLPRTALLRPPHTYLPVRVAGAFAARARTRAPPQPCPNPPVLLYLPVPSCRTCHHHHHHHVLRAPRACRARAHTHAFTHAHTRTRYLCGRLPAVALVRFTFTHTFAFTGSAHVPRAFRARSRHTFTTRPFGSFAPGSFARAHVPRTHTRTHTHTHTVRTRAAPTVRVRSPHTCAPHTTVLPARPLRAPLLVHRSPAGRPVPACLPTYLYLPRVRLRALPAAPCPARAQPGRFTCLLPTFTPPVTLPAVLPPTYYQPHAVRFHEAVNKFPSPFPAVPSTRVPPGSCLPQPQFVHAQFQTCPSWMDRAVP